MAGIGEASAILAIAQFGVKFSVIVWEFAGEVQGARKEIGRLVRNIRTTSERLQDIGRLLNENPVSHLFNEGGIESAVRCSNDCEDIISDVTKVLLKAGREPGVRTLEQKDLDISKLEAFFWPFVKKKLVSPQADLERVKADLMLLLHSAMALKESNPLQSRYALEIPRLKQWAEQATRRSESVKHRTESSGSRAKIPTQREAHRNDSEDQVDPEMRQRFLDFQVRLAEEAEDRRVRERAAYLRAEDLKRQEAEDASRKILEQNAVTAYKQEQEDKHARAMERETHLKDALTELGLEPEKIQSIVKMLGLQMPENGNTHTSVSKVRQPPSIKEDHEDSSTGVSPVPIKPYRNSSWLHRVLFKSSKLQTRAINGTSGDDGESKVGNRPGAVYHMEVWLIGVLSGQLIELETSQEWVQSHMKKTKHRDTLRRLAQMKYQWQMAVQYCIRLRNEREATGRLWKLFSIGFPRKVSKVPLFGHYQGDCFLQLAICQREDSQVSDGSASSLLPRPSQGPGVPSALAHRHQAPMTSPGNQNPATVQPAKIADTNHLGVTGNGHVQNASESSKVQAEGPGKWVHGIPTVIVEGSRDKGEPTEVHRNFTLIPKDLINASALKELDHPFSPLPQFGKSNQRQFLRVPVALDDEQITLLVEVSMAHTENKQALLTRLPDIFKICRVRSKVLEESDRSSEGGDSSSGVIFEEVVEETDYRIFENTYGDIVIGRAPTTATMPDDQSHSQASNFSVPALDAKFIADAIMPASHDRVELSKANIAQASRHYDGRSSSTKPRQSVRRGETKNHSFTQSRTKTHHDIERNLDADRANSITQRPVLIRDQEDRDETRNNSHEEDDSAREAGADEDHHRKGSFERLRPFQQPVPTEATIRRRRTVYGDASRTGDMLKQNSSDPRPDPSLLPGVYDDHTTTRHGERNQLTIRAKQPKPGRIPKAAESKGDTLLQTKMIASRRRHHQDSLHDSDNSEPSERGVGRLVRFESRSNVRRPMRRLTGYKSSERTLSRHMDPGHDAQRHHHETMNDRKGSVIPEAEEDEEDVISRTLKRYTTFNSDVDHDMVASPDEADFSGLSDNDPFDVTTLKQAKKTLRRLVEERERALKDGDLMRGMDLKFYAIPDIEARMQQLTRQSDQGLEDCEDEVEDDARHGPQIDVPAYDPDHQMDESDIPDVHSGEADRRHDDESDYLEVIYDREREVDAHSAQRGGNGVGSGSESGSQNSPSE